MLKKNPKQAEKTAQALSDATDYLTHSKIIDHKEAKSRLKLKVKYISEKSDLWKKIWELYVRSQRHVSEKGFAKVISSSKLEVNQSIKIQQIEASK